MKKRTVLYFLLCATLPAWVSACVGESSSNITVQIAPLTDLCAYATYDFYETDVPRNSDGNSSASLAQIDQVVKSTMSSYFTLLGLTSDTDDPDLKVSILYTSYETSTPVQNCVETQAGEWYGYEGDYNCEWVVELVTVTKGSVMVDMIDMSTGGLVFRAIADGIIVSSVEVSDIDRGLREMFSYWPLDCGL
jgi:hypothetical protein